MLARLQVSSSMHDQSDLHSVTSAVHPCFALYIPLLDLLSFKAYRSFKQTSPRNTRHSISFNFFSLSIHSKMSDDDEYYEFEDDYMYEDLVPDMVVSQILKAMPRSTSAISSARENFINLDPNQNFAYPGRSCRFLILRSCPVRRPWH